MTAFLAAVILKLALVAVLGSKCQARCSKPDTVRLNAGHRGGKALIAHCLTNRMPKDSLFCLTP